MFAFAMDCWVLGFIIAWMSATGWHYKKNRVIIAELLLHSFQLGMLFLAISNWLLGIWYMWRMWY